MSLYDSLEAEKQIMQWRNGVLEVFRSTGELLITLLNPSNAALLHRIITSRFLLMQCASQGTRFINRRLHRSLTPPAVECPVSIAQPTSIRILRRWD